MKPTPDLRSLFSPLALLCLCFLPQVSLSQTDAAATLPPRHSRTNIIFISIDTLRQDHLGCYGYQRNTSPNIDRLADRSVLFENFIAQAVLTPVSQMSIFSSQYLSSSSQAL